MVSPNALDGHAALSVWVRRPEAGFQERVFYSCQ
jgi:hypothetical protein